MRAGRRRYGVMLLLALVSVAGPARADDSTPPWATGVSQGQKDRAQQLLTEGNELFVARKIKLAEAKYRQALAAWNHPAIRFNLVRTLVERERFVDAHENLQLALAHGAGPFEAHVYREALRYRTLLAGRVAQIAVACARAGVAVSLDGRPLMVCPGTVTKLVEPGVHPVVARKPGFVPYAREVLVLGGKTARVKVQMVSVADATITRRRWRRWKPWAVIGGGVLVAGIGGLLQLKAQRDFAKFGDEITRLCVDSGCAPDELPAPVRDLESQARLENQVAIGTIAVGAAAVITGVVMTILNTPTKSVETASARPGVAVAPALTTDGRATLMVSGRF